jgi:hypothetical protein
MKTIVKHRQPGWKFSTPLEGWLVLAMTILLICTVILFVYKLI